MDQTNRQQIEVICDRLSALRTMVIEEGYGLLAHLIAEALEEAEKLRISAISPEARDAPKQIPGQADTSLF